MNRWCTAFVVFGTALSGCQAKPAPAPAASASAAPAPSATAAIDPNDIPTPEDFEQEALDQVNAQNLDSELDKLERDIGS